MSVHGGKDRSGRHPAALVVVVVLLCCGGTVSAILLGGLGNQDDTNAFSTLGCGQGGPIDPDGELPKVAEYGVEQIRNAAIIINVGADLKLPPRAWVIAVATAMQESSLTNHGHLGAANDHDSLGLFQQRPSAGWGTPAQVQDPEYAAGEFYERLVEVPGWRAGRLTDVAQAVQRSAYPELYQQWEPMARALTSALDDDGELVLSCG